MKEDFSSFVPPRMLSEINVTPFVDVMLVLLIVFMISAPLMQQGVQVDLPQTNARPLTEQQQPIILTVRRDGQVRINKNRVPLGKLSSKLRAIYKDRKKKEIFIQADRKAAYGMVAKVLSAVQLAGVYKIGLVTKPNKRRRNKK